MDTKAAYSGNGGRNCFFYKLRAKIAKHVRLKVRYSLRGADGKTRQEIFEGMGFSVTIPAMPFVGRNYLNWFHDINSTRVFVEGIPQRISFTEIANWMRIKHLDLSPPEIEVLTAIDGAWCAEFIETQSFHADRLKPQDGE